MEQLREERDMLVADQAKLRQRLQNAAQVRYTALDYFVSIFNANFT